MKSFQNLSSLFDRFPLSFGVTSFSHSLTTWHWVHAAKFLIKHWIFTATGFFISFLPAAFSLLSSPSSLLPAVFLNLTCSINPGDSPQPPSSGLPPSLSGSCTGGGRTEIQHTFSSRGLQGLRHSTTKAYFSPRENSPARKPLRGWQGGIGALTLHSVLLRSQKAERRYREGPRKGQGLRVRLVIQHPEGTSAQEDTRQELLCIKEGRLLSVHGDIFWNFGGVQNLKLNFYCQLYIACEHSIHFPSSMSSRIELWAFSLWIANLQNLSNKVWHLLSFAGAPVVVRNKWMETSSSGKRPRPQ